MIDNDFGQYQCKNYNSVSYSSPFYIQFTKTYMFCNYYQTYSFQNICKNYNSISYYSLFYIQFTKIYVFCNYYQQYSFQNITIKYEYLFFPFIFMLSLTKLTFAIIYLFFKYISIVDYFYLN